MDLTDGGEAFRQRLAELRAQRPTPVQTEQIATPSLTHDPDLVPDISDERSEESAEIDDVISRIDIIDGYVRWCGKMRPEPGGKREGIMISCPNPAHPDKNPSAWINLDQQVYYCGGCAEGGDIYDIAAYHFGFPVPGYKDTGSFPDLRRKMATDLGYTISRTPGGSEIVEAPTVEAELEGSVTTLPTPLTLVEEDDEDLDGERVDYPSINWREILTGDTFLRRWMEVTAVDDSPEEYYFWLGLQAIGFAGGRDVYLSDNPAVIPNLYVCLFGSTGQGKSRSVNYLIKLLREALPYDHDDPMSTGTYVVPTPGSAEALVDNFSKPVYDPTDPKSLLMYGSVRGLVRFDELAALAAQSNRMGSVMKPTLMEFYDAYNSIEIRSRGHGLVRAEGHFCQSITTTQPRAIRKIVSNEDVDSGFLNRWIFASGPDKQLIAYGRDPVHIDACVEPLRNLRSWSASGKTLILSGDALELWTKFFDTEIAPMRKQEDATLETRVDLTLKKLIVLMAINYKSEVTAEIVQKVLNLYPYLKRSYRLISGEVGLGAMEDCHQKVLDYAKKFAKKSGGKGPSLREIWNALRYYKYDMKVVKETVSLMCVIGELKEVTTQGKRGPATTRYHYAEA